MASPLQHLPTAPDPRLATGVRGALLGLIRTFEFLSCRWPGFASWYGRRFYGGMVGRELQLAAIRPGGRVLHIGCGPYPFTSLALARHGFTVLAVDSDPAAIRAARRAAAASGLGHRLQFQQARGQDCSCSGFDAIWVSLHVSPQDQVLSHCLQSMDPTCRLVFRQVTGPLKVLYDRICPVQVGLTGGVRTLGQRSRLAMQTVICRQPSPGAESPLDLASLVAGQGGLIADVGIGHPLLHPLGIRQGRHICVKCVQRLGGPVVADVAGRRVAIDRRLARQISVLPGPTSVTQ